MAKAVGIIEVYGLVAAFVAADAACKAADVTLEEEPELFAHPTAPRASSPAITMARNFRR